MARGDLPTGARNDVAFSPGLRARTRRTAELARTARFAVAIAIASLLVKIVLFEQASLHAQNADPPGVERVVQKTSKLELRTLTLAAPRLPALPAATRSPFDLTAPGDPNDAGKAAPSPEPARPDNKNNDEDITPATAPTIYSVIQHDGAGLLLSAESGPAVGWVQSDSVIALDEAFDFFTRQARAKPKDAFAFAMLGLVHHDKGALDAALRQYDQAISLEPKSIFAITGRARVLRAKHEYSKAVADYTDALKLDPRNALALRERADLHVAQKDHDKAIADFSALIKLRSEDPDALRERAIAWFAKGDYRQAISDYTEAMRVDPSVRHTTSCPAD